MAVTWHDILKFDGFGGKEIASEVNISCPEFTGVDRWGTKFNIGGAQTTIDQDYFEGLIRKESTPTSPFRWTNEGVGMDVGVYERTLFKLFNATKYFWCDASLIDRDRKRGTAFLKNEGKRMLEDTIVSLGKQFFYGGTADGDAKGFQGLQTFVDGDHTVKAGGSTHAANSPYLSYLSSVYMVRFNPFDAVSWLFGRDGLFGLTDIEKCDLADPVNAGKYFPAYRQRMEFYPGLAYQSKNAAVRIANIDVSTASTPGSISRTALTDEHLLVAARQFKGAKPDAIFMPYDCGVLLGASRQPTISISGSTLSAGMIEVPKEWNGIPVLYTDSLSNNEPQVA